MLSWILRRSEPPFPPLAPADPLVVIGDVHGRDDLLEELLAETAQRLPQARRVLVGDLIDRGPDSRDVLTRARDLKDVVVLRGNHEEMLLRFLDAPETGGEAWLRHGGIETLASFGITDPVPDTATRDALRRAMAPGLEDWLRALPLFWQSGNVAVVHAAADPRTPIAQQNPQYLLWGHPGFGRVLRRDGVWVVHGHVIRSAPGRAGGVISIDTGAWRTGQLTAALISAGTLDFLTTGG
ncbi:metallophosphoesterase [Paenirhodobacter populi]|uniref:Serine/threonine protein phosphatase n=1 Tax=Paenirhodobacter populi TaxID=2306993 RepID=A0A443IPN8_9RHOB|nr:metallophosphoesterase [Sinirhodobacter populi]RWR08153.1 serine/threonine protein phosphatase [Sinirhodobacter populi]